MRILYYSVLDRIVILKNELKQLREKIRYVKRHFKTLDRKRWKAKWESSSPQQFSNTCWAASYALCLHWLMPRHKCNAKENNKYLEKQFLKRHQQDDASHWFKAVFHLTV